MLWLYRLLFLPALLVMAPRYLWRMRRRGGYAENFRHRFGGHAMVPRRNRSAQRVWLQAVSVGEMLAIGPLLERFREAGIEVYLTTTTSTGYRIANDRYRGLTVGIGYFPIDWWLFSRRAWKAIAPDVAIIAEGERWPEHLHQAAKRNVPVLCINARLSDRSFERLKRVPFATELMFGGITRVLACSAHDEERFRALGVPVSRLTTTGNIKLDLTIPPLSAADRAQLRAELGLPPTAPVLVGSSTWPGEERALVDAWQAAGAAGLNCSLLIVPRHAERRAEIERALQSAGVSFHFRSKGRAPRQVDVSIADTTGELRKLLQLADLVFVGKSLPPHSEGQTPVEAAALEKPMMFGPGMTNFRRIAEEILEGGAAVQVQDAADLKATTLSLLSDAGRRQQLAASAAAWHRENAGAVDRTWRVIESTLAATGQGTRN